MSRRWTTRWAIGIALVMAATACAGTPDGRSGPTTAPESTAASPASTPEDEASATPDDLTVSLGWIKNVEFAGMWLGLDRGYYADNGIDLTVLPGGPQGSEPVVSVLSGESQIGIQSALGSVMEAISQDNDLVIFGAMFQDGVAGVVSLADNPIRTPEDLVGIRFLGQEGIDTFIDAVFELNGLDGTYEFIPAGFSPQPLVDGDGEAYSAFLTNQPITLEVDYGMVSGQDYFTVTWGELGLPAYADLFFATREWLDANRDLAVRFMRATLRGWEENATDPEAAARLAVEKYGVDLGLDLAQQIRQNELQTDLMVSDATKDHGLLWVDTEWVVGPVAEGLRAAGFSVPDDIASHIDMSILTEAAGE
ncbi:ABC transporter substrate-binding protein [Nitriliruptor alkaliphilus]|uniref:ABC transporter substrate-binding protein n=1 Tax=Nitriliruptor alkaliphilus TaxID=427918 RepID=UPI0006970C67|nr:ABC transporter substrate-binding protein [Nitriliruptor alkaliphilus]